MTERGEVSYGLPPAETPDVHDLIVSGQLEKALSTVSKGGGDRVSDGLRGENPLQRVPIPRLLKANTWSGFPIRKRRRWRGLSISIENPAGTYRTGTDSDGNKWRSLLHFDYGYLRGTLGVDNDHVDCFIGPNINDAKKVFVIHQKDVKTGKYDEDKVMLGWLKKTDAIKDYLKNYDRADMLMGCTAMNVEDFKKKVPKTNDKPRMIKAKLRVHK